MAPRNGYNNVQYPCVDCHFWDPIELRFQFRDGRHPIAGATWESCFRDHLTIWPSQTGKLSFPLKIHGGIIHQFQANFIRKNGSWHHHPIFRFWFCLVLTGLFGDGYLASFRFGSPRVQNGLGLCSSPWLAARPVGGSEQPTIQHHSTRIRTSQLVYYCICHIYMNLWHLWWVNGFSYLKESQFYSSRNSEDLCSEVFPFSQMSPQSCQSWPGTKRKNSQAADGPSVGELVFSWENCPKIRSFFLLPKCCEVW